MTEKTVQQRQVCKCENCGNEAEMVVTCKLPEPPEISEAHAGEISEQQGHVHEKRRVQGQATCTHCGNEADIWVDLE